MSLVLKSNNVATASLGNVNGLPSQDYALFLDFEGGQYYKKVAGSRVSLTESEVLTCTSQKNLPSQPMTMDRVGSRKVITTQQPRFWGSRGRYGLLIEAEQNNWFLNSAAPVTQTISNIPVGSTLVASCIGSGSIMISGAGINPITVTENSPQTITPPHQASVVNLNVTVVGSLSHVQIVRVSGIPTLHTPITSGGSVRPSGFDNIEINQALLAEVLSGGDKTILFQTVGVDYTFTDVATNETRIYAETDSHVVGVSLNKKIDSVGMRLASYTKAGEVQADPVVVNNKAYVQNDAITQAIVLKASGFSGATNGGSLLTSTGATNLQLIKRLLLGTHVSSPVIFSGSNCIFTKVAIFNKALTDSEVQEYSESWI
ncbi:hypothetical protein [Acinetobacter calcoaceticus]